MRRVGSRGKGYLNILQTTLALAAEQTFAYVMTANYGWPQLLTFAWLCCFIAVTHSGFSGMLFTKDNTAGIVIPIGF